jgi:hypothetical protein
MRITAMCEANEKPESDIRFLELLDELTRDGRAEWVRTKLAPGFVYCLLDGEDLIVFECMGGEKGDAYVSPIEELAGVVAHHCNTTYLWLPVPPAWDRLIRLLRLSRDDDDRCCACAHIAYAAPVRVLEERLRR